MSDTAPIVQMPTRPGPNPLVARCPECAWKEGPCNSVQDAARATTSHVEKKHGAMVAFLRGTPLPEVNEAFARKCVENLLGQKARIERARQGSRIVGPDGQGGPQVDIAQEMGRFIEAADLALMSILDLLVEMRTGKPVIRRTPQPEPEPPAEASAAPAPAAEAKEEAKAS